MRYPSTWWSRGLAVVAAGSIACLSTTTPAGATGGDNVNVVGYSVVGPAYKALEAAFQATSAGSGVTFTNSFGASDTETNNVVNGQPADLVNLSYEPNVATLVAANLVPKNWQGQELSIGGVNTALGGKKKQTVYPTSGIVTDSVVAFIVRKGNPLGINSWASLVNSGVQIVTPNPTTSGSARWNLLAAYASEVARHKKPAVAQAFLKAIIEHTVAQPVSGSAALSTFLAGTGNVLIDYEDDGLAAIAKGDAVSLIVPPQTILIENPIALTNTGLSNPGAKAFYQYLFSSAGQTILAGLGYRSVLESVWKATGSKFPSLAKKSLVPITKINPSGWSGANVEFFSPTVVFPPGNSTTPTQGIVTYLEQFAGHSV